MTILELPLFPSPRVYPLDPPPVLRELQASQPVARVRLYGGTQSWLLTGYETARTVLHDETFSADAGRTGYPQVHPTLTHFTSGMLNHMDGPEHDVYRRMLAPEFIVKRVDKLRPLVASSVEDLIATMLEKEPVVDLVEALSIPLPALVMSALLGVPYSERDYFVQCAETFLGGHSSIEQVMEARTSIQAFLAELVERRRVEPQDDLLSRVVVQYVKPGDLSAQQLVGFAELLLTAGFDTTQNTIALGTLVLLQNPDQLALLKQNPSLVHSAVEEMLRYLTLPHLGRHRVVTRDIEVDGHLLREGDGVIVALNQANRDPAVFSDPDRFDIRRSGQPHLGFGYGPHQCLGAMVARTELRAVFSVLFERIPTLALAVPLDQIRFKHDHAVYGCESLPVTWDRGNTQ
jgi:cytochrome P450